MRRSSLRHPVAVLRQVIGLNQPDFASVVGIAESTLAKIETTRLPLSPENAIRISTETGVSFRWLIEGDSANAIVDEEGNSFTESTFVAARAARGRGEYTIENNLRASAAELSLDLHGLLLVMHSAHRKANMPLIAWRLHQFVRNLAKEFGESDPSKGMQFCLSKAEELVAQIKGAGNRAPSAPNYRIEKTPLQKSTKPGSRTLKKKA